MRSILISFFAIFLVVPNSRADDRLDELFAAWQNARCNFHSLIVEFSMEKFDRTFNKTTQFDGSFRLLRSDKGEYFATFEMIEKKPKAVPETYLLNKRIVYSLHSAEKKAVKWGPKTGGDLRDFLENYFIPPFILLLDRKRAEAKAQLSIAGQDRWYTYLRVIPKDQKCLTEGRVSLTNQASEKIPKGMPRQLWLVEPNGTERKFNIKSWRLNPKDAPKLEEFVRPEDRPGWQTPDGIVMDLWNGLWHPKGLSDKLNKQDKK